MDWPKTHEKIDENMVVGRYQEGCDEKGEREIKILIQGSRMNPEQPCITKPRP
jgi:hypothetical protein